MSRRRRPRPRPSPPAVGRVGRTLAALVVLAAVTGGVWVWRTHPEYLSRLPWMKPGAASGGKANHAVPQSTTSHGAISTIEAQVYFVRVVGGAVTLLPVAREVPAKSPARGAIEELIAGGVPPGCDRPLPEGVKVRGVRVDGGIATADFSDELVTGFGGGSSSEEAAVYSIVNTLTSVPGIARVQILVSGKQVETIGGHLDVRGPLAFDGELVRK